jgi:Mg2+ and Co2+ transporter CorA
MTFLTGVFGMNFSDWGTLEEVLHRRNGTEAFYFLAVAFSVFFIAVFYQLGLIEMLVSRHWNKYTAIIKLKKVI